MSPRLHSDYLHMILCLGSPVFAPGKDQEEANTQCLQNTYTCIHGKKSSQDMDIKYLGNAVFCKFFFDSA